MIVKLRKLLHKEYFVSMVSKVFCVCIGFLFTVFQSRFLGPEIKGQVATINSVVSITSIIFSFGIYQAYPYFKRKTEVDIMPIFMKISVLLLAVYMFISLCLMCVFDLSMEEISIIIITPLLVYDGLVSYITLIERPNKRSVTDVLVMVAELIMIILLWLMAKPSLLLGIVIIVVKDIAKAVIFTFWWRKRIFVKSESVLQWLPKLVKYGFFPMLSLLMSTLNYRLNVILLDGRVTDAAIGIYSVGVLLAERVWMVPDALKGVMVSNLSKGRGVGEVAYAIRLCNTICLVLIAGIVLLGKPFISLFFGPEYDGAYQITVIIMFGVFAMSYYKMISNYNIAMGKQMVSFVLLGIGVIVNLVANLSLIPNMGTVGAALSSVISYTVSSILFITYFCITTKVSFGDMLFVKRNDLKKLKRL